MLTTTLPRSERSAALRNWRNREAAAKKRRAVAVEIFRHQRDCRTCGQTMDPDGLFRHRPVMVQPPDAEPFLVCFECHGRIKADCERRSRDTGELPPTPVVIDDADGKGVRP